MRFCRLQDPEMLKILIIFTKFCYDTPLATNLPTFAKQKTGILPVFGYQNNYKLNSASIICLKESNGKAPETS